MYIKYLFDPTVHRTQWYSVKVPEGWKKEISQDEVLFISPEKNIFTEVPEAFFSIYAKKAEGALFLDDIMIQVMESLHQMNGEVLKHGEIKVDGQVSKWVLFHNTDPDLVILTFYITDDFNRLFKIQFSSNPKKFKQYRPIFEEFKNSFKFKQIF